MSPQEKTDLTIMAGRIAALSEQARRKEMWNVMMVLDTLSEAIQSDQAYDLAEAVAVGVPFRLKNMVMIEYKPN